MKVLVPEEDSDRDDIDRGIWGLILIWGLELLQEKDLWLHWYGGEG